MSTKRQGKLVSYTQRLPWTPTRPRLAPDSGFTNIIQRQILPRQVRRVT